MHWTNIFWLSCSVGSSSDLVMENGHKRMCGRVPRAPIEREACTTDKRVVQELIVMHWHVVAEAGVGPRDDSAVAERRRRVRRYWYAGEFMFAFFVVT